MTIRWPPDRSQFNRNDNEGWHRTQGPPLRRVRYTYEFKKSVQVEDRGRQVLLLALKKSTQVYIC